MPHLSSVPHIIFAPGYGAQFPSDLERYAPLFAAFDALPATHETLPWDTRLVSAMGGMIVERYLAHSKSHPETPQLLGGFSMGAAAVVCAAAHLTETKQDAMLQALLLCSTSPVFGQPYEDMVAGAADIPRDGPIDWHIMRVESLAGGGGELPDIQQFALGFVGEREPGVMRSMAEYMQNRWGDAVHIHAVPGEEHTPSSTVYAEAVHAEVDNLLTYSDELTAQDFDPASLAWRTVGGVRFAYTHRGTVVLERDGAQCVFSLTAWDCFVKRVRAAVDAGISPIDLARLLSEAIE
jgi:hypothetical protein